MGTRVLGSPVLGTVDDIAAILRDQVIDEVLIAIPRDMLGAVEKVAKACEEEGIRHCLMADVFDTKVARVERGTVRVHPAAVVRAGLPGRAAAPREAGDRSRARPSSCSRLLLPLIGVIAVAIKLDSPGPGASSARTGSAT